MRINWNYIKVIALIIAVTGLFAFSNGRSDVRKISQIQIEFVGDQNLYITEGMVNKLLIQSYGSLNNVPKEKLVLNKELKWAKNLE